MGSVEGRASGFGKTASLPPVERQLRLRSGTGKAEAGLWEVPGVPCGIGPENAASRRRSLVTARAFSSTDQSKLLATGLLDNPREGRHTDQLMFRITCCGQS